MPEWRDRDADKERGLGAACGRKLDLSPRDMKT